ncbi:MAG: CHAT domain-containing protein [Saprospiraceae bacterium]
MDQLINHDSIRYVSEIYSTENKVLAEEELHYLTYKLNKNIFYQNYFSPCDSISFVPYDTTELIFKLLNDYYTLNKFHEEKILKNTILDFISKNNEDNVLRGELYGEIGRFYLNEGSNPDSSDHYYNIAFNIFEKNRIITNQHFFHLRNLVYLQFPLRKELKALAYIERMDKMNQNFSNVQPKRLIYHSLKAFVLARLDKKKESDMQYQKAFNLVKTFPCSYHQQELYKLYFSSKSNDPSESVDATKLNELKENVHKHGNFCNMDKIIGEYLLLKLNNVNKAEQHLEKAFHYIVNSKPYNALQVYTVMYELYYCYMLNKKYDSALDVIYSQENQLIPIKIYKFNLDSVLMPNFSKKNFHFITLESFASVLNQKYEDLKNVNDLKLAASLILKADSMIINAMNSFDENVIHSVFNSSNSVYNTGAKVFYNLYEKFHHSEYLLKYIYMIEKNKDRILLRDINLRKLEYSDLKNKEKYLKHKIAYFKSSGISDSLLFFINKLEKFYKENATSELANFAMSQKRISLENWQKQINNNTILVDVNIIDNFYYVFYMSVNESGIRIIQNDSLLQNYISVVKDIQSKYDKSIKAADYNKAAYQVYKILFSEIISNYETVIYSDSPFFSGLNPESLTKNGISSDSNFHSLNYLIHNQDFEKVPSFFLYFENKDIVLKSTTIVSFLHSDEKTVARNKKIQKELPGNITEFKTLNIFSHNHINYSGKKCSKANFLNQNYNQTDILHISIHGYSNSNSLNDLYLLFRSDNKLDTLYGYEILNLEQTPPLVILSACESGKGKFKDGEGNYNLARYFLHTGSHRIIQSLWNLDDSAGSILMKYFYQNLTNTSPSIALKEAKLKVLKHFKNFGHPYFWSGMV